jgi:hypothetical protein
MRKRWTAGDPCPKCETPLWAESDRYKPGRAVCRDCGLEERRKEQAAARARTAKRCRVCAAVLAGNDIRQGACKPCRVAEAKAINAARKCPCGTSISHRSKNARFCGKCQVCQKAKGATAGSAAAMEKRRKACKEQRAVVEPVARPVRNAGAAYKGLRGGPDCEWATLEDVGNSVARWATLDGGRV